jgi:uncharacterized protein YukE
VLPSRSHLQGWNPESLSPAASALSDAGQSVYTAVRNLDDGRDRMPEARAWDGPAHKAATEMFRRATDTTSQFSHYIEGVAAALSKGAGTIGGARTALLNHAGPHTGGGFDDTRRLGDARYGPVLLEASGIPARTHLQPSPQAAR